MSSHTAYVIAYDLSCDRERGRVDKLLQGVGFRVQKSVFEARLNRGGHQRLVGSLGAFELRTGFVKLYALSPQAHHVVIGDAPPSLDDAFAFIV